MSSALEPFLLLAKNAKGAAIVQLIQDSLSAPGVYIFSELLDLQNVRQLQETNPIYYNQLQQFAYGTLSSYRSNPNLPALNQKQLLKLKQLTLVSLASRKVLPYQDLLEHLDLKNVRELEDMIIGCIYANILTGKLDQKKACFEAESAIGRDLSKEAINEMLQSLNSWSKSIEQILNHIESKVTQVTQAVSSSEEREKNYEEALQKAMENVKETKMDDRRVFERPMSDFIRDRRDQKRR